MKTLIICFSYHHKNTEKVAQVLASTLNADLNTYLVANPAVLPKYTLIGFGSGIYFGKPHKGILNFADKLPMAKNQKAFIFSTSSQEGRGEKFHKPLREKLQTKGYNVIGEFNCPGYDTYTFTKLIGGIKKGRPNQEDLKNAEAFAQILKQKA